MFVTICVFRNPCPFYTRATMKMPRLRRRTRYPCPGSARRQRRREEDPGSIPWICNSATTEKEGERSEFMTRDLQPAEVSGEERDMMD
jgi:hypothetical protein